MSALPYLSASDLEERVTPRHAVDAIVNQLRGGFDPAADFDRQELNIHGGSVLVMPSSSARYFGIKVVTVAEAGFNDAVPRIQGTYTLFDGETLSPVLNIDAAALTLLRTPAVTFAAILATLEASVAPLHVVTFGTGPLGQAHHRMLASLMRDKREVVRHTFVGQKEQSAVPGYLSLRTQRDDVTEAVKEAHLIFCATSASEPLFDSSLVRDDCVIAAVGSHSLNARELDSALIRRSNVIVEDIHTSLREAGDIVRPMNEGMIQKSQLLSLAALIRGEVQLKSGVPTVFKSTGMSWEDLTIASLAYELS